MFRWGRRRPATALGGVLECWSFVYGASCLRGSARASRIARMNSWHAPGSAAAAAAAAAASVVARFSPRDIRSSSICWRREWSTTRPKGFGLVSPARAWSKARKRSCLIGERPCLIRERPCLIGERPCLIGERPCLIGERPCLTGARPCLIGERPCLIGERPCLIGERPCLNWRAPVFDWRAPVLDWRVP